MLPLDSQWRDESGRRAALADYLHARPAIVVPGYFECANLCSVVLQGLAAGLAATPLRAGRDFEVAVISIAPLETPAAARRRRDAVLGVSPERHAGWHFLTADDAAIRRVTQALGYRYAYDEPGHQYAHAAGLAIVGRDGRIARVLYGVAFASDALANAIAQAGATAKPHPAPAPQNGGALEASTSGDPPPTWLLCFHYDPRTGRYSFAAMTAVRGAGLVALLALAAGVVRLLRRERTQSGKAAER